MIMLVYARNASKFIIRKSIKVIPFISKLMQKNHMIIGR